MDRKQLKLALKLTDEVAEFGGLFELEIGGGEVHLGGQVFDE